MKELEFNHIAPYLPDGLKYQMQIDNSGTLVTITVDIISLDIHVKRMIGGAKMLYGLAKPIYHPLSDLTKETEHNGEKFVPMKRLASIATIGSEKEWFINNQGYAEHPTGYTFYIESIFNDLVLTKSSKWKDFGHVSRQYELYQKLFEWHFWIFDQAYFEKGIILNINKLKL